MLIQETFSKKGFFIKKNKQFKITKKLIFNLIKAIL